LIEKLPENWSQEAERRAPADAARYQELQGRLEKLNERRKVARETVDRYKAAKKLLEPFQGEENGLQESLVTKNGHLERELERMRMLMLRVERGIAGLEGRERVDEMEFTGDPVEEDQKKLSTLLSGP
jgi:hypothetical protein